MQKELNPEKLLQLSGIYWQTCALHAAVKLDIFTTIGKQALTADAVASKLGAPARSTAMMLDALCGMALLEKQLEQEEEKEEKNVVTNSSSATDQGITHALYTNTAMALEFLSKDSPRYIGFMIMHHHHLVESWSRLDEAIMNGAPVRSRASIDNNERREHFLMGMFNIAMGTAPALVPTIDLSGKKRLLDMGGGPGTYAIQFCLHNPQLTASVFDLPTSRPFAEKTIARFNQEARVDFQGGDFLKDDIEGQYDVVWISHILHAASPDECRTIIKKAASALLPDGMIIIHDFILDTLKDSPLFPTLFSLNMLLATEGGQAYSEQEITEMLETSGFVDVKRTPFIGPNDSGLITGVFSA